MSLKLKILGLSLLAVMATSAFAVVNASATSDGHFVAEPPAGDHHVIVRGAETVGTPHRLHFNEISDTSGHPTTGSSITCTHAKYHGTLTGAASTTTQAVQVRPEYIGCSTNGEPPHNVVVDVPAGCGTNVFEFTSGGSGTVHVNCTITITHPNCEITIPSGSINTLSGISYTTVTEQGKHALTMHVNVKTITGTYHGGLCVFLGTTHYFEMVGSVTVWGEDTVGNRVGITHTTP